jgi:hypothetical protein
MNIFTFTVIFYEHEQWNCDKHNVNTYLQKDFFLNLEASRVTNKLQISKKLGNLTNVLITTEFTYMLSIYLVVNFILWIVL